MEKFGRLRQPHQRDTSMLAGTLMACGVVLAPLLLGHPPARAENPAGCIKSSWINEVAHFVAVETRSNVPEVCVRFARQEKLDALVPSATATVAAVYVPTTREILLAHDLDLATPLARSYLVHELVHAQQLEHAHERASCTGALEDEAYNLQALYLHTQTSQHREDAVLLQVLGMSRVRAATPTDWM
jgi:hypothetical protein